MSDHLIATGGAGPAPESDRLIVSGGEAPAPMSDYLVASGGAAPERLSDQLIATGGPGSEPVSDHLIASGGVGPAATADQLIATGGARPAPMSDQLIANGGAAPAPMSGHLIAAGGAGPAPMGDQLIASGGAGPAPMSDQLIAAGGAGPESVSDQLIASGGAGPAPMSDHLIAMGGEAPAPMSDHLIATGGEAPAPMSDYLVAESGAGQVTSPQGDDGDFSFGFSEFDDLFDQGQAFADAPAAPPHSAEEPAVTPAPTPEPPAPAASSFQFDAARDADLSKMFGHTQVPSEVSIAEASDDAGGVAFEDELFGVDENVIEEEALFEDLAQAFHPAEEEPAAEQEPQEPVAVEAQRSVSARPRRGRGRELALVAALALISFAALSYQDVIVHHGSTLLAMLTGEGEQSSERTAPRPESPTRSAPPRRPPVAAVASSGGARVMIDAPRVVEVLPGLQRELTPPAAALQIRPALVTPSRLEREGYAGYLNTPAEGGSTGPAAVERLAIGALSFADADPSWSDRAVEIARAMPRSTAESPAGIRARLAAGLAARIDRAPERVIAFASARPQDASAQELLGYAYQQRGQLGQAERAFQRAIELDPERLDALNAHAKLAARNGHGEQALASYNRLYELSPGAPSVSYGLADQEVQQGRPERAKSLIDQLFAMPADRLGARHRSNTLLSWARSLFAEEAESAQEERRVQLLSGAVQLWPENQEAISLLSAQLRQNENLQQVQETLEGLATQSPSPLLTIELADCYRQGGYEEKALDTLTTATSRWPNSPELRWALGDERLRRGQLTEAREAYEAAAQIAPSDPRSHLKFAELMVNEADFQRAKSYLEDQISRRPWSATLYKGLGDLNRRLSKSSQDTRFLSAADEAYARALELDPSLSLVRLERARVKRELGDATAALEDLNSLRNQPQLSHLLDNEFGQVKQALGRYGEAREHFSSMLRRNGDDINALRAMGEIANAQGEKDEARGFLERAFRVAPRDPGIRYQLGRLELDANAPEEAIEHFEQALVYERQNPKLQYWYGRALEARGGGDGAAMKEAYERAAEAARRDPQLVAELCDSFYRAGRAHAGIPDEWGKARADFQDAISCAPQRPEPYYELARLHQQLGEHGEAQRRFERAVRANPRFVPALRGIAEETLRSDRTQARAALRYLKRAERLEPRSEEVLFDICSVSQSISRNSARRACRNYLRRVPRDAQRREREIRQILRNL